MSEKASKPPTVFPVMKYQDAPAALGWLEAAFGLRRGMVVPGDGNAVAHAEMTIGAGGVMLGSLREPQPGDPWAVERQGVYVVVEDVDAHYATACAVGADIVEAINDTDYGSRQYSARDPEGHLWCFGTYRPGDDGD